MRRAGRIPVGASYKSEAVWAVATLCITLALLVGFAVVGAKPSAFPPAPVVPAGTKGGDEIQADLDELTKRAEAAEADAKSAKEEEAQKESELASTKTDLASAVKAKRELEAEIQSLAGANGTSSGKPGDPAAALKSLQAELASTRVQLTDAQAEAKKEATQRHAAEAKLKEEATQRQAAEAKLKEVQEELAKAKDQGADQGSSGQTSFGDGFFQAWARPWYMAFVLAVAGGVGILGPSSYVRVYLPVIGSLVGGLMCAGLFEYMGSASGVSLFDAMMLILTGSSGWFVEFIWLGLFALGIARWVTGVECSLWEVVDDVVVSENAQEGKEPLLGCGPNRLP